MTRAKIINPAKRTPRHASRTLFLSLCFCAFALFSSCAAFAQDAPIERTFLHTKPEVEKALQPLRASASGRLPLLDGFIGAVDQPLERFERAYYQCTFQLTARVTGDTIVRVHAKISAWYAAPNPAEAGYRVLPSNGRLENDLLDRLAEALDGKSPSAADAAAAPARPAYRLRLPVPNVRGYGAAGSAPAPATAASTAESQPAPSSPAEQEIDSLRKQREAAEKRMQQLNAAVLNLEEIQRTQAHPANLAAVRKTGAPILAKPQDGARVLFAAEAQDQFEILDLQPDWVHVQISGASRGWIRRAQLELPERYAAGNPSAPPAPTAQDQPPYRVTREETGPFPGKWEPLQGQTVKIIWVQPVAQSEKVSTTQARRSFAKSLFLQAAVATSSSAQPLAGILILFDTADGGEVAATLNLLQQWQSGALSDDAFWQRCFLDPPEAFRDSAPR
ncbi:MAG: hypothetical protein LAN84_07300 [Acidobacteriia bacterium]|nr:hypothetical protein [Terriglobia bacterium]